MLNTLLSGKNLSFEQATVLMRNIMQGEVPPVKLAAILAALRVKGETVEEIAGLAKAMREFAVPVHVNKDIIMDVVGTGGDGANTFNISTTASFVVAAAGVTVAKHGNRAASSKAGSADVLEACGVNLDANPNTIARAIEQVGVGFMFARNHHPAMRYAAPVRAELGVRTVFNILGPLTNPANPTHQVIGVFNTTLPETFAAVFEILGARGALIVHGDGLDELTTCGINTISELKNGKVNSYTLHPEDVGLPLAGRGDIQGGDATYNAQLSQALLSGGGTEAQRNIVALNAGAALYLCGTASSIAEGVKQALEVLDSARGLSILQNYARFTQLNLKQL